MKQLLLSFLLCCFLAPVFGQQLTATDPVVEVKVYPNPAVDYIGLKGQSAVKEFHIYNLVGKRLKSFQFDENTMYFIGDLPRGVYLVQIVDPRDRVITTRRLNKQ